MKKNLLVIIILTITIVAGIYSLHEVRDETLQMQSTLQQSAIPQIVPARPQVVPVKLDKPVDYPAGWSKFGMTYTWFAVDGKEFFMPDDLLYRYGKYWIDSTQIGEVVKILKNKEAMRDKARSYHSPTQIDAGVAQAKNAFDWNSPLIYKGIKLAEFQVWSNGKLYLPLGEFLAVEGYPVSYPGLPGKFASIEQDKMEKEWLKHTGFDRAMEYAESLRKSEYAVSDFTKYPLTKELFKPQYISDMVKGSLEERGDLGYFNNAIAGNKQTMLRSTNADINDIYIKLDRSLLSEKIPYTASYRITDPVMDPFVIYGVTKAGEEVYYFGNQTREITQGKYKGWRWVPNSNVIYTPADKHKNDGMNGWNDWVELLLLPIGTKLTVQNYWGGMSDEQVTVTNQVFKPLWDINNKTK